MGYEGTSNSRTLSFLRIYYSRRGADVRWPRHQGWLECDVVPVLWAVIPTRQCLLTSADLWRIVEEHRPNRQDRVCQPLAEVVKSNETVGFGNV
jgi:hypothetical protein